MEKVKQAGEYTIYKKRSGRYGVQGKNKKWVNGADKVKVLTDAGLVKVAAPAKKSPAEAEAEA